jgi:hypothetical protein
MTASTKSAAGIVLLLGSTAAIFMTVIGLLFLIAGLLISLHVERFIGEIDGLSIALVFAGVALALKVIEKRLQSKEQSLTD